MVEITKDALLKLILTADDEALGEGAEPKQRTMLVVSKVMNKLNYTSFVVAGSATPEIVKRIREIHQSLYRQSDIAIGGIHGGIFMFRDIFIRVDIPMIFGSVKIDPIALGNFSENQVGWLHSRPADLKMYMDQFIDIMDFAGCVGHLGSYKRPPAGTLETLWLAAFQLQAAAATLAVAFDFRGAIQSAIIGAELAVKGGLKYCGASEKELKDHGHNLASAAKAFSTKQKKFDTNRVLATIARLPPYVANRYSAHQPGRVETGHIVMGAQYIAGEVARQISEHSMREAMQEFSERTYPGLDTSLGANKSANKSGS
jgi:hypothetical protein